MAKYICKENYVMSDTFDIAFHKGRVYEIKKERDNVYRTISSVGPHELDQEDIDEYFSLVKGVKIKDSEQRMYSEEEVFGILMHCIERYWKHSVIKEDIKVWFEQFKKSPKLSEKNETIRFSFYEKSFVVNLLDVDDKLMLQTEISKEDAIELAKTILMKYQI